MESNSQKRKRIKKEGAEKVYEDDTWLIVRPFTIEASNVYGTNTRWCTVSHIKPGTVDNIPESLFYGYIASGGVYYIIDKSTSSRDNNPLDTIKEYCKYNLSHYIAKVVIKYEAVPKIIITLLLLINFIIVSPILLLVFLYRKINHGNRT